MKRTLQFFFAFTIGIFVIQTAIAQSSFTVTPSDTVVVNVMCNQDKLSKIEFVNQLSTKLSLSWEKMGNTIPGCIDLTFCDYGLCLSYIPAYRTMDSIDVGLKGYFSLDISADDTAGTGYADFKVYQTGYPDSAKFVTFKAVVCSGGIACGPVGIADMNQLFLTNITPNPAKDLITINSSFNIGTYQLFDLLGNRVLQGKIESSKQHVSLASLSKGLYFMKISSGKNLQTLKIVKE